MIIFIFTIITILQMISYFDNGIFIFGLGVFLFLCWFALNIEGGVGVFFIPVIIIVFYFIFKDV